MSGSLSKVCGSSLMSETGIGTRGKGKTNLDLTDGERMPGRPAMSSNSSNDTIEA